MLFTSWLPFTKINYFDIYRTYMYNGGDIQYISRLNMELDALKYDITGTTSTNAFDIDGDVDARYFIFQSARTFRYFSFSSSGGWTDITMLSGFQVFLLCQEWGIKAALEQTRTRRRSKQSAFKLDRFYHQMEKNILMGIAVYTKIDSKCFTVIC